MPFNPFSALTSKIFGGVSIILLFALAGCWVGKDQPAHAVAEAAAAKADVVEPGGT